MPDRTKLDVVIVGAGIAGLAAELEAKKAGARVLVLEKLKAARGKHVLFRRGVSIEDLRDTRGDRQREPKNR